MIEAGVKEERSNWRDKEISKRHRHWGFDCPAVDLDFVVVEYNTGLPVALIEYKRFNAERPAVKHPTYRALLALANGYHTELGAEPLPFLIAYYWPDTWAFRTTPVNEAARAIFKDEEVMTEWEFVKRLYALRYRKISDHVAPALNKTLPKDMTLLRDGARSRQSS